MDSDSDLDSDVDSLLSEGVAEAVSQAVEEPLSYPTPCPVCSACQYSHQLFRSANALLQHSSHQAQEMFDPQQRKVKVFHEALIQKIRDGMDAQPAVRKRSNLKSVVQPTDSGIDAQMHEHAKLDDEIRKLTQERNEIEMAREKKRRQHVKTVSQLEEVKHQLMLARQRGEKINEITKKEVDRELDELNEKLEVQMACLTTLNKSKNTLEEKLAAPGETMSQEQKADYTRQLLAVMRACSEMDDEKKIVEEHLANTRQNKAKLEAAYREIVEFDKELKRQLEEVNKMQEKIVEDVEDVEGPVIQLKNVGLDISKLPRACVKCGIKFETSANDKVNIGRRVVLENCGCLEYCATCVSHRRFTECPKHREPIGDPIPFICYR